MDEQELCYWQEQAGMDETLDSTPDPDFDLDDAIAEMIMLDDERQYFASRF